MGWKFWGKNKKPIDVLAAILPEQLQRMDKTLNALHDRATRNNDQLSEVAAQMNKIARMLYKTGQETHTGIKQLNTGLEALQQWQATHDIDAAGFSLLKHQVEHLVAMLIRWLDDIDMIRNRLETDGQNHWRHLLEQWTEQILAALAETGIQEINILGSSFNPQLAEAIGAVEMPPDEGQDVYPPYAVVEVVRRGYITSEGRLLRKAQVITIKEDN
ncbi:nucleotide exchange factor GrpE [Desulfotomaculum copahuensis]|uniref:Nucleotide exchange factor GrpE n=1 Tax=Desulfotomaculum copahuensis TaxID=1838280 RepID=A0A1B7LFL9_9FIRM|nr:nucleotide exchange factor GrpE [Desulfotomaculum copahuensis]OAT82353.1 hypothetical protein A6M21_09420 [Desulfotomaculum copahuensis]